MSAIASSSKFDPESRGLEVLLEAFGSRFSLEDIATAYCHARQNVDMAGEILSAVTGSASKSEEVDENATGLKPTSGLDAANSTSSNSSSECVLQKPYQGDAKTRMSKPKKCSVSVGTVAGIIGKEYVRPRQLASESCEPTKPMKIDSKEIPETEMWSEEIPRSIEANNCKMQHDVEDFLLKMLGDGFQFNMTVIREVLGICGYDAQKSMEKLLDLSDVAISDNGVGISTATKSPEYRSTYQEQPKQQDSARSDEAISTTTSLTNSPKRGNNNADLPREVLEALFTASERFEEEPEEIRVVKEARRSRAFGRPVVKPFEEPTRERTTVVSHPQAAFQNDEDAENGYEALRIAAKEHWFTMKEYYRAAIEAFVKGDNERANRLMEKGHFFKEKAREADEKSTAKLIEVREDEIEFELTHREEETVTVDMHDLEPREAVRLLRVNLTSFSSIPSIRYLRVIVGIKDEDTRGPRKRRITRLLEKESIGWVDEDNGLKMIIRVDMINPKSLSFAKKD